MFSKEELERYSRHLILEDFGIEGQKKLKNAKVLVVGAGGLGSPVLLYLAAAGVGTIGIVDFDNVDSSNLQRQILYSVYQEGKLKVEAARERLLELNPFIKVNIYNTSLTRDNALSIIENYDIVADGTDNFPTRYLINDACCILDKVNVFASIFRFEGQVTVFNYKNKNGEYGPNYRDLYPEPPPANLIPNCAEAGVLGVLPGIIGSLQASEVIKIITQIGVPLSGRLFIFDAKFFSTRIIKIMKHPSRKTIKELINYEQFCGIKSVTETKNKGSMKTMTVQELKTLQDSGEAFQLIDVREAHELAISTLGALHIPMGDIPMNANKINTDTKVVIHCRSGGRSGAIVDFLEKTHGWDNLYNLTGGINAYAKEVDTSLTVY